MSSIQALPPVVNTLSPLMGWFIHYKDGSTGFVYSDPIHWPPTVIRKVASVMKMPKPMESACTCINCTDGEAA